MIKLIKKMFQVFGINISRFNSRSSSPYQLVQALNHHEITIVFDVGANIGQFATSLRNHGYDGKIVSFEPLSIENNLLISKANKDAKWTVHRRCAVGATFETQSINISKNSVSSSILSMLPSHLDAAPESIYIRTEMVDVITLDSILNDYILPNDKLFIKIDTQGYEWAVLEGASDAMKISSGLLLELSMVELYKDQHLYNEIIDRLKSDGFNLYSIQSGFVDPTNGKTLQFDGIFFK
jgi:FkbM family methyltransferase